MMNTQVEYVGFVTRGTHRVYTLRIRRAAVAPEDVTVLIDSAAFVARRARYQDGPEICFLKLQKELLAVPDTPAGIELAVNDADLEDYRTAHLPKPPKKRKPPVPLN